MMFKIVTILCLFLTLLNAKDVTKNLEYIGTPYKKQYRSGEDIYSRNVWDMVLYNGKIFIGAGNSANEGPSINSGPVYLIALNPNIDKFENISRIDDDQVDKFKILNKKLFIPGHDAKGSWDWGNFYIYSNNKNRFKKFRNIPNALHIYDLVLKDGKLFSAIGLDEGAAVGITKNYGKNWEIQKLGSSRVYTFLELGDELFALKKFKRTSRPYFSVAQYIDGNFIPRYDISIYKMFPKTRFEIKYSRATRIIKLGNKAIYVGAYKYNSHQTKPFGLYKVKLDGSNLVTSRIFLDDGYVPRDIIKRGTEIFVLTSKKEGFNTIIKVLKFNSKNLNHYKELFYFNYPTFARSFELYKNSFYFGMGSDVDEGDYWKMEDIKKETGNILKYEFKEL